MFIKAFLIAVSDYSKMGVPNIPCLNDLYAMKRALINGLGALPDNITLLGEKEEVKSSDFIDLLHTIKKCSNDDVIVFYFSGHGGSGNIYFSDGFLSICDLIEFFKLLNHPKVLIFDCCYSGVAQINEESNFGASIERLNNNCVVFASCREHEKSGFNNERGISLYTSFLCDAIMCSSLIKHGQKSIDDIANFVLFLSNKWSEKHGLLQHPIFRSSLTGTLSFDVKEYVPFEVGSYYYDCDEYIICSVEPLHNSIMRYAIKVILKGGKNLQDISELSLDIVNKTRHLRIFQNKVAEKRFRTNTVGAQIVFCYFGFDEEDVRYCTWAFRSTWVDDSQDKEYWYKTTSNSQVVNGVLITEENHYNFIRSLRFSDISEEEFKEQTENYFADILQNVQEFIRIFRECDNGTITEIEKRALLEPISIKIQNSFFRMGNLPAYYLSLQDWFDIRYSIASDASNMSLFYIGSNYDKWSNENRNYLVKKSISDFQENIAKIQIGE